MSQKSSPFSDANASMRSLPEALCSGGYQFVTTTPLTHSRVNARPGNACARSIEDVFGWSRPFARETLDPDLFDLANDAGILLAPSPVDDQKWRCLIRASTLDGMTLLHSAFPTDAPDAVFLGPDTYRFEAAIKAHLAGCSICPDRAIDIGCGSGAGGLVIARACPSAETLLTDVNQAALDAAAINAASAGCPNVRFMKSDLFDRVDGHFDLIVANPPYLVDSAMRQYRHGGGQLGAALSLRIADQAIPRLAPGGSLLLYTGSAIVGGHDFFLEALPPLLDKRGIGWSYREIDPDVFGEELQHGVYEGADRIAAIVLTVEMPK